MITPELKYAYIVKKSSAFICLLSELHMNIHQQTKKKKKKKPGYLSLYTQLTKTWAQSAFGCILNVYCFLKC